MFRSVLRRALAALALAALIATTAAPAYAASTDWKVVEVTLQTGDQGQSELVVSGTLPPDAGLPAEAELAVPAGTEMRWIGEILGGPVSEDPSLQYTKTVVQGMDVYRFTLTKSRIAQFEGNSQGAVTFDGVTHSTALKWTAWRPLAEVHLRERLPQGAQVTQPAKGATVESSDAGSTFYSKTITKPKAGQVLDLTFAYTAPAAVPVAAAGAASGSDSNSTAITIILVLVAVGFGMLLMGAWQKMSQKNEPVAKAPTAKPVKQATSKSVKPAATKPVKQGAPKPVKQEAKHVVEKVVEAVETSEPDVLSVRARAHTKAKIAVIVICAILAVGVVGAVSLATSVPVVNGKITRFFGSTSECSSASIAIVASPGVDLAAQGGRILDAFTGQDGVGNVTLDVVRSTVDVGFCESSQSEESVRRILADTGLVSLGASVAPVGPGVSAQGTSSVDPNGKTQTLSVDTASGEFSPATLVLKAGIPAEIAFGQGSGCLAEVVFPDLNIRQSLEGGPVKVRLPALEPGTYAFACGMDMKHGTLVVK